MPRPKIDGELTSFKLDADLRIAIVAEFGSQGMAAYLRRIVREDLERRGRIKLRAEAFGPVSVPRPQATPVGEHVSAAPVMGDQRANSHRTVRDKTDLRTKAAWTSMRQNSRESGYPIVSAWDEYATFESDMGPRTGGAILVRIDQRQGWSLDNCKWGTKAEVVRNRSVYKRYTIDGETKTLTEWARASNINRSTVQNRVINLGWSIEDALKKPVTVVPVASPWKIKRRSAKNPSPVRKKDPRYKLWRDMRYRCKKDGDSYVPEWNEFWIFCRDMGERPPGGVQLRQYANKPYGPGNSYWGTKGNVSRIRFSTEKSRNASV